MFNKKLKVISIIGIALMCLFLMGTFSVALTETVEDLPYNSEGPSYTIKSSSAPQVSPTIILNTTKKSNQLAAELTTENTTTTTTKKLIDNPIKFSNLTYKTLYDINSMTSFRTELKSSISKLEAALKTNNYTTTARETMEKELTRLKGIVTKVEADLKQYNIQKDEYYYATKVWEFFRQRGYSEAVTSAIIGNMMIETSGGTLELNPTIYNPSRDYYGLCQWSLYYKPFMAGKSFEQQLEYLDTDMAKEFKTFGKCYRKGFTYEDFLAMTDPEEAAVAFAAVYERCGSGSYNLRRTAAQKAYNYFT